MEPAAGVGMDRDDPALPKPLGPAGPIDGILHVYVAFDLGEEVDLAAAKRLVPAEYYDLPRHARTPRSIGYQPPPLRSGLGSVPLELTALGQVETRADATLFNFGGVNVAFHVPFRCAAAELSSLANSLSDTDALLSQAAATFKPLFEAIRPAIQAPQWSALNEEYFVFQILPQDPAGPAETLLAEHPQWLAGLVRLDSTQFSSAEVQEALRLRLSYGVNDLAIVDWAAAVLVDRDCDETLETIAFANLQLLEFRHIDDRLDRRLQDAYAMIHQLAHTWLPFWRSHTRPLRALGELKVEINEMMERSSNVLKLIGDQYLARLYQILTTRFHADDWGRSVRHSLEVIEGIYQVVSDQAATFRSELLEWIIIALILFEIVMTLFGR
jgi:hypothetical protein